MSGTLLRVFKVPPVVAGGGLSLVNVQAIGDDDGGVAATLPNFVVSAGSNRLLVVAVATFNDGAIRSVTTATYGLQSLSLGAAQSGGSADYRVEFWRLIAPTETTADIVVTVGGTCQHLHVGAFYFTGGHQTTPLGAIAATDGTGIDIPIEVTPASAVGDIVIDTLIHFDDGVTPTPGAGQTARWNVGASTYRNRGSNKAGAATSTAMNWDQTGNFTAAMLGAIAVKPA